MRIQYIKHSGFLMEFEHTAFIFDYFEGEFDVPDITKQIYFFVSHKHQDHFSYQIFDYAKKYEHITFVLSNDIKMNEKHMDRHKIPMEARDKIIYIHKNETLTLDKGLLVETLTSTDEGVAYLLTYEDGKDEPVRIYHAGDLNWWTWIGESKEDYDQMTQMFMAQMKKLEGHKFDYAFVPLDPRQEERFWWGLDAFMKVTDTTKVFPMHCWEDYSVIPKLKSMEESLAYRDRIVSIDHCGQTFIEE